jgi:hypothetical protein
MMKTFQEHTSAKANPDPIQAYRPLKIRRPRLNEQLVSVLQETLAEVLPPSQPFATSDVPNLEFLHRLMVRLDREIGKDPHSTEVHRRLSFQNTILSFLVLRLLAAEVGSDGGSK